MAPQSNQVRGVEIGLPPVSVIIAAYNEELHVAGTVASILDSGFPCQLIVVDDGSTDGTREILKAFADRATIVTHPMNRGKGAAIASGLRRATGSIVVFCDAHLTGLNRSHLLSLVLPLVDGSAREVLGVDVPSGLAFSRVLSPCVLLTGQRAYFREDLAPLVPELEDLGYGIEAFLYSRFPRGEKALVLLHGLVHLIKTDMYPLHSVVGTYLRETFEVVGTLATTKVALARAARRYGSD